MAKYKQLCSRCKKKYILVGWNQKYARCYDCQKTELNQEIENDKMKKFFDIPEEFYEQNFFLRNVKIYYLRNKSLTDKQKEAFKKTVKELKEKPAKESLNNNK